ncbi:ABC transporter permease [Pseudogemmobacter bohemicus]|uniref:ABC transporter permease n=1 Tax=Pseudogemmobacter bohemicus TaxID=2250708 RepID=UPI000DD3E627|nr:ABC transporter permease [Pseudogemmobacter bohemicus]
MTLAQTEITLPGPGPGRVRAWTATLSGGDVTRLVALATVALVFIGFAVTTRGFFTSWNILNVIEQSAIPGILALAMALVILTGGSDVQTGGIDLSLAANMGLSAAIFAVALRAGWGEPAALAATLGAGMLVGVVNGLAVVRLGILPLLATLAMSNIVGGLELVLTENTVIPATSPILNVLSAGSFLGLSSLTWVLILVSTLAAVILHASPPGLRLYATGGHPEAARAAGVSVGRLILGSYAVAGFTAAFAAILSVSRLSASSTGTGEMLLSILAAALLGTVFSRRGVPTVAGTLIAVLFIGFLSNGFQLKGLSSNWVSGVQGALILAVVAATALNRRKGG